MALDPFYTQYLNAGGIPITASAATPPEALVRARSIVAEMLEHRPDVRAALVKLGARVVIMAETEGTMDLPEQRDWKKPTRDDPALFALLGEVYGTRHRLTGDAFYLSPARVPPGGPPTSTADVHRRGVLTMAGRGARPVRRRAAGEDAAQDHRIAACARQPVPARHRRGGKHSFVSGRGSHIFWMRCDVAD
ncbi:hypothetical protein [Sphingomonas sp.]|uniref:hypothetical protein n=1 Tax=Sphingomonas sp. TaxID=28214 RepID=UPI003B007843